MRNTFKRIPITFWTIIVISVCSYIVSKDIIIFDTIKIDTLSKILTIVGLYYLALQVKKQTKTEQISTEYLNQPNFKFNGFGLEVLKDASPCLCSDPGTNNYNLCSDTHWFNITQIGNLPAKDMKIILIHEKEKNNILELLKIRTQFEPMVYKDDEHQFKLVADSVPISLFEKSKNGLFYILMEYKSIYTEVKYKRVYELAFTPNVTEEPKDWIKSITYYSLNLIYIVDTETITWKNIIRNLKNKFLILIGAKKTQNLTEWSMEL